MSDGCLKKAAEFLEHLYRLKDIKRRGWMERGVKEPESVADHSFCLAFISMLLADAKGLDVEKAIRIALLHDLCEALVGDRTPADRLKLGLKMSEEEEDESMERMLSRLPWDLSRKYLGLWKEYRNCTSEEARLVKELDKLERALQAVNYTAQGRSRDSLEEFWKSFLQSSKDELLTGILKEYMGSKLLNRNSTLK